MKKRKRGKNMLCIPYDGLSGCIAWEDGCVLMPRDLARAIYEEVDIQYMIEDIKGILSEPESSPCPDQDIDEEVLEKAKIVACGEIGLCRMIADRASEQWNSDISYWDNIRAAIDIILEGLVPKSFCKMADVDKKKESMEPAGFIDERSLMKRLLDAGCSRDWINHKGKDLYVFTSPMTIDVVCQFYSGHGLEMPEKFKDISTGAWYYNCEGQYII